MKAAPVRKRQKTRWYQIVRVILPGIYGALIFLSIVSETFLVTAILLATALVTGAFYCGWLCPFGFIQEWTGKLGRLLKLPRVRVPRRVERILRFSRYVLFGLSFLGLGFVLFLDSPYGSFLGLMTGSTAYITTGAWILLGASVLLSLFVDRPFCRYVCTKGARHGALSMGRVLSIRRNPTTCINCRKCDTACPTQVPLSARTHVRNPQCINCFECIAACPVTQTLTYGWAFKYRKSDRKEVAKEDKHEETSA